MCLMMALVFAAMLSMYLMMALVLRPGPPCT
jgi:hypothetical protein